MVWQVAMESCIRWAWRHLATTIKQLCAAEWVSGSDAVGGDAACSQITVGNLVIMFIVVYLSAIAIKAKKLAYDGHTMR